MHATYRQLPRQFICGGIDRHQQHRVGRIVEFVCAFPEPKQGLHFLENPFIGAYNRKTLEQ
jgi:hypothetical protein